MDLGLQGSRALITGGRRGDLPALRAGIVDHRREHRRGRRPALPERPPFRLSPEPAAQGSPFSSRAVDATVAVSSAMVALTEPSGLSGYAPSTELDS